MRSMALIISPMSTPQEGDNSASNRMTSAYCEITMLPHLLQDLPLRMAEFGTFYRYEQSGDLPRTYKSTKLYTGWCSPLLRRIIRDEFKSIIDLILYISGFHFNDFTAQVSLRDPENSRIYWLDENWERAERGHYRGCSRKEPEYNGCDGWSSFLRSKLDFMVKMLSEENGSLEQSRLTITCRKDLNLPIMAVITRNIVLLDSSYHFRIYGDLLLCW